ncbi:heterokaryon incompatibility protein-domain-containing protein [Boeremia exigua]|uniref:heterokaryon incompatibility protein-domain-containing protein n=1 Tax=Boeremia exigua TaxID=749465 RepID=UPI001E8DE5E7|nr:heterokaryon incompatibility protein-domain-containing protein [Boeremia exigua]KAH6639242.1 heterokaryon incompatibility protein-domain-containing protein [Boeremia exigua]
MATGNVALNTAATCYSPLESDQEAGVSQFRIATLLPGEWAEPIRCRLAIHSLHDPPRYETISYAWGDPQDTGQVFVDNVELTVPSSLVLCLRHLRSNENELALWTDAICIDQSNQAERALQVMNMGAIYWRCFSMYVWLGEPVSLSKFENPFGIVVHWAEDKHFYDYPGFTRSEESGQWVFTDNAAYQQMYAVFVDFISKPWWTRLWCVQEIALCPQAIVVSGSWRISWASVLKAKESHVRHDTQCCAGIANQMPARYTYFPDHLLGLPQRSNLIELDRVIRGLRHKLCKDPRDKIYGLLGLLWNSPYAKFTVDYSLPVGTLYQQTTEKVIQQAKGDLQFLTGTGMGSDCYDMPSWVRNFAAPLDSAEASHEYARYKGYNSYNASGHMNSATRILEGSILSLSGKCIDRIESIGSPLRHKDWTHVLDTIQSWLDIAGLSPPRASSPGSAQDRFWRAVLGDYMPDSQSGVASWSRIGTTAAPGVSTWYADARARLRDGLEPLLQAPMHALWIAAHKRMFFCTGEGHFGLCFPHSRPGDEVWVLAGGKVLFVLRPAGGDVEEGGGEAERPPRFKLIGECYLHGFMDGEALDTEDEQLGPLYLV